MTTKQDKPIRARTIEWEAATWKVERINDGKQSENLSDDLQGTIKSDYNIIAFRYYNDDQAIKVLFHEMFHKAFPAAEEAEVMRAEVVIKSFLEALGVDLSPMLEGYK